MARAPAFRRALRTGARMALAALVASSWPARAQDTGADEAARLMQELMSGKAAVGGPFTLTDTAGRRRSLVEFRGRIVLLYFGYTSCPDTCPADLAQIAHAVSDLDGDGTRIQPLFITLDPDRDTARVLRNYLAAFDARLIGLRGTREQIEAVARAYKVAFRRVPSPGSSNYLLDHSTFTFVIDREGKYLAFFPPGTPAERMEAMLRGLLPP